MIRRKLICAACALVAGFAPSLVRAQLVGFGGNGTGWSLQGSGYSPSVSSDDLHLIAGYGAATSAFNNTAQTVSSFTASFTFQNSVPFDGWDPGDGFVFTLQNAGPTALGGGGGSLGYQGISSATGVAIDLWIAGGPGTGLANSSIPYNYQSVAPVDLHSTHPIDVSLSYDGTTLSETLHDTITNDSFSTSYVTNIAGDVGGNTAFVGFTGGTGGAQEDVHITNFSFNAQSQAVPDSGSTLALLGLALAGTAALRRRRA